MPQIESNPPRYSFNKKLYVVSLKEILFMAGLPFKCRNHLYPMPGHKDVLPGVRRTNA